MKCPKCGSDRISETVYTTTDTESKEYNVGSGICGALLLGWSGLLCGLCDGGKSSSTTVTKVRCKCNNCGANLYKKKK